MLPHHSTTQNHNITETVSHQQTYCTTESKHPIWHQSYRTTNS